MNRPKRSKDARTKPAAGSKPPPASVAGKPAGPSAAKPGEPIPANSLNPEEQMERFAKELKENDWGHQPC